MGFVIVLFDYVLLEVVSIFAVSPLCHLRLNSLSVHTQISSCGSVWFSITSEDFFLTMVDGDGVGVVVLSC